jgi:nicotinate-nucleotide adenylyltransferase
MLGGAFDPPHCMHVQLARCALEAIPLDELRVVPTGQPVHRATPSTSAEHRLAMLRLAFADVPGVVIDRSELDRDGPSYTVQTLRDWRALWPDAQLALILGADQAAKLAGWHAWPELFQLATIYVAPRASCTGASGTAALPQSYRASLVELPLVAADVSATAIRASLTQGVAVDALVPPAVARYIDDHHLYTETG